MEGGHGPQSATISSHPSLLLTTGPPCSYPSLQAKPWPHSTFPCNPSGRWCVLRRPPGLQTPWEWGLYKVWGSGWGRLAQVWGHGSCSSRAGRRDRAVVKQALAMWKEACGARADGGMTIRDKRWWEHRSMSCQCQDGLGRNTLPSTFPHASGKLPGVARVSGLSQEGAGSSR